MDNEPQSYRRKYSIEQYKLAELMLTHEGFSFRAIARVCRMSERMVAKLAAGDTTFRFDIEDEDDE